MIEIWPTCTSRPRASRRCSSGSASRLGYGIYRRRTTSVGRSALVERKSVRDLHLTVMRGPLLAAAEQAARSGPLAVPPGRRVDRSGVPTACARRRARRVARARDLGVQRHPQRVTPTTAHAWIARDWRSDRQKTERHETGPAYAKRPQRPRRIQPAEAGARGSYRESRSSPPERCCAQVRLSSPDSSCGPAASELRAVPGVGPSSPARYPR